jgi:hypothetical protein
VLIETMMQDKIVDMKLDIMEDANNPIVQEVVKAYMGYFLSSISEKQFENPQSQEEDPNGSVKPAEPYKPGEHLYRYHFSSTKLELKAKRGTERFNLKLRIPVKHEMTITENLASWYDGVKNNKKCISSIVLNDQFFKNPTINMILDLEAEKMFGDEVNYVTVNVRKKRTTGNPYQESVIIDREYMTKSGLRASLTYSAAEDKNPDVFEFKTQWSLKGGNLYPENPPYTKGDWKGITLVPPVTPRFIQFEGNLERMKEMGIRRATLQLRYQKFGQEIETNIPLTVSQGIPLVEKTIYTDRDTRGYVSRLIVTHEKEGKLALDWESNINDDYVFATIPDELNDKESAVFKRAIEIGKEVLTKDGEVSDTDKILDKFKEIFDIIKD